jgi:hypothetical protein
MRRDIWHPTVMAELPLPLQFLAAWIPHGDDLGALAGRAIRLRFHLGNRARIHAFELARQ